jgi:PPOX class probable F420-dependent enzyme
MTVGRDGTPQPNPVGFLWDGGDSLVIYSQAEAGRLANIRRQPQVWLHFYSNGRDHIVVLTGTAEILDDYPAVPDSPRGWRSMASGSTAFGSRRRRIDPTKAQPPGSRYPCGLDSVWHLPRMCSGVARWMPSRWPGASVSARR